MPENIEVPSARPVRHRARPVTANTDVHPFSNSVELTIRRIAKYRDGLAGREGAALFDALNRMTMNTIDERKWYVSPVRMVALDLLRRSWRRSLGSTEYVVLDAIMDRTLGFGKIVEMISYSVFDKGVCGRDDGKLLTDPNGLPYFPGLNMRSQAIERNLVKLIQRGHVARFKVSHGRHGDIWSYHLGFDWPVLFGCLDAISRPHWGGADNVDDRRVTDARGQTARVVAGCVITNRDTAPDNLVRDIVEYIEHSSRACAAER